ncbi:MAG: DUF167 domain-containing protein [Chloroflexi bacterium]|nr:DUF167 domain-containing protein [Chloroflexota bacterium]
MVRVKARVKPGARVPGVKRGVDGALEVAVRAPAVEGQANRAVVRLLAERLGLREREVRVVAGERGREKLLEFDLDSTAALWARLEAS